MPEIIRPLLSDRPPRLAVIDFDGTLSLIRSGWVEIMVGMMVDVLRPLPGSTESDEDLVEYVTNFVLDMNGGATVFQMEYFVARARERGGHPESADHYTLQFLKLLGAKADHRIEQLKSGELKADDLLVPGAIELLSDLQARGVQLTMASGTPKKIIQRESELLGIAHFFEGRIFGPEEDWRAFSKLAVMRRTLVEANAEGVELLGVGDGFVEIENVKEVGGIAIGCATDETHRSGQVEDWKRARLIRAGADLIIPDYRNWHKVAEILFPSRA
ncbi:HAD family hydrolase [Schlesneria paludicola]|uniref:HAD family hydrolase n=1 Tax=Schlesneria paludicola TaxID=360056 RepID=UPI00029A5F1A|nr:HAD family hydrolase [Schlesneria paludicola]